MWKVCLSCRLKVACSLLAAVVEPWGARGPHFSKVPILPSSSMHFLHQKPPKHHISRFKNPKCWTALSCLQASTSIHFETASATVHSIANASVVVLCCNTRWRSKVVQWSLSAGRFCLREKQRAWNCSTGRSCMSLPLSVSNVVSNIYKCSCKYWRAAGTMTPTNFGRVRHGAFSAVVSI